MAVEDILRQARILFPYFPAPLIRTYVDAFVELGDRDLALARTRQSDLYDDFFPGNRRDDGTLRLNEAQYLARLESYRQILEAQDINPDIFEDRLPELIEGETSPTEFRQRVDAVASQIDEGIPELRDFLSDQLDIPESVEDRRTALLAAALDPSLARRIGTEIAVANLRAQASTRGLTLTAPQTRSFLQRGLNTEFVEQAAATLPALRTLASRFRRRPFDVEEFAQASLGLPGPAQRISSLFAQEEAQFSRQGGVRFGQRGQLTGLEVQ